MANFFDTTFKIKIVLAFFFEKKQQQKNKKKFIFIAFFTFFFPSILSIVTSLDCSLFLKDMREKYAQKTCILKKMARMKNLIPGRSRRTLDCEM